MNERGDDLRSVIPAGLRREHKDREDLQPILYFGEAPTNVPKLASNARGRFRARDLVKLVHGTGE